MNVVVCLSFVMVKCCNALYSVSAFEAINILTQQFIWIIAAFFFEIRSADSAAYSMEALFLQFLVKLSD